MCKNRLSVFCVKYAESLLPESMAFQGGNETIQIPISFAVYLIKTGDRNILVDAGCHTMPGFDMKDFRSPVVVLGEIGLLADDITDVIITHGDHDHIEDLCCFEKATLYITEEEYIKGKRYIPGNMPVNLVKEEYVIAPRIKMIKWGGHGAGSAIVEIAEADRVHVLAGDECYVHDCISRKIPTGMSYHLQKSRAFVEKYSDQKYCVHTCHDISLKTGRII